MYVKRIQCSKHGLVEGYYCKECRAEKYVQKVKDGLIEPKKLVECDERPETELLPLQIRFRAFQQRSRRVDSGKAYSWEQNSRIVRIFPSRFLEGR